MSSAPRADAGILRFGSLTARLRCEEPRRAKDVAHIFGTSLVPSGSELLEPVGIELELTEPHRDDCRERPPVPEDGMVLRHADRRPEIHTEVASAMLDLAAQPVRARVALLKPHPSHFELCVHLAVVLHKLLFLMDRVVLHAAAIRFAGRVSVFLGDRGAGKSTIALRLARAGGTVLGEDHLILRRCDEGFFVSGCDERSRLEPKTERYFFDEPLPVEPIDFDGRLKKEMPARALFCSQPYADERADLVFFARPAGVFRIERLSRRRALLELMSAAGRMQRFVDATDRGRFLALASDFMGTVTPHALSLSDDLRELDRLVRFLEDGAAGGPA